MSLANTTDEPVGGARTAFVVGGASGMGAAVASRLADVGHRVAIGDIDPGKAKTLASQIGEHAIGVPVDATSPESVENALQEVTDWAPRPTMLIYAAGTLRRDRFEDLTFADWRRTMAVNLDGAFLCSQAVLGGMKDQRWGRIVLFSSTAGKSVSTLGGADYTTSKTALLGLTRALAAEVSAFGVTVNAVCPGLIDTPMISTVATREQLLSFADGFPIQRLGEPDEVAALIAFLCSDKAGYITGAAIDINGGDLMT